MNTMIRIAFLTALVAMVASCEFFKENDLLEDVKKDPPVAGADTDTADKDDVTPDVDNAVTCGNGGIDGTEECDSSSGTASLPCDQLDSNQYSGGTANCSANCVWDRSGCIAKTCGDGTVQTSEQCDISLSETKLCTDIDPNLYNGGQATCADNCTWNLAPCVLKTCGNGTVDTGEECEGAQTTPCDEIDPNKMGTATCISATCKWDTSECTDAVKCGNGGIDTGEVCDGGAKPCVQVDPETWISGDAYCNSTCNGWDTDACEPKSDCTCGNGTVDGASTGCGVTEACELTQTTDCEALGYDGTGTTVDCKPDCTGWDTTVCGTASVCGNGTVEGIESCDDGNALNGTYGHCNTICTEMGPHCGDNNTDSGYETCDDGNQGSGDGCSSNCKFIDTNCTAITAGPFNGQLSDDGMGGSLAMFVAEFTPNEGSGSLPEMFFFYVDDDFIPVKSQVYLISESVKDDYGSQAMVDYDGSSGTVGITFLAYDGQMFFNDYDLDGNGKFTDSAWGQVNGVYFGEVNSTGQWVSNGQCRYLATASWDLIDYPVITDLTASYSGTVNTVQLQWTAPGNPSRYNQYRICVDGADCNDVAAGMSPGGTEIRTVTVSWYTGNHQISVQPLRDGATVTIAATITVDTDGHAELAPVSGIDFGLVGYNSYLDRAVTINNTSSLVDLIINETTLPMDCTGKVTILSGTVTPASQITVDPGTFHAVVLRYAPTETSTCTDGQFRAQYIVTDSGGPTYAEETLPVIGSSENTPPVITDITFSKNPVKNSEGTTRMSVFVQDENVIALSVMDGVAGFADLRELGDGPRVGLGNTTYSTGENHWHWWRDIDVSTLGNGVYVIPITVTDSAGHTAKTNASFAVYSGNIVEVGDGKTYTTIRDAVTYAGTGDVVVVYPGTYTGSENEDMNPNGDMVIVYGIDGPENTIISSTSANHAVLVNSDVSDFVVAGFTFTNHTNGPVYIAGGSSQQKVTITNCKFENNSNTLDGGAIEASGSAINITVAHSVFRGNSTPSAGGAIYAVSGASLYAVDVLFDDNTALIGGAVAVNSAGPLTFDRCTFTGNEGTVQGGALNIVSANGMIEMRNSIVTQNLSGGHGGGLFIDDSTSLPPTVKIYNSTIVENVATYDGGGIIVMKGSLEMKDSILFFNTAGAGLTTQLTIYDDGAAPVEVSSAVVQNCAIGGGTNPISDTGTRINAPNGFIAGQQGNIIDDPQFVGGTTGGVMKYRLNSSSPCIDTGSDGSMVPTYDFLGYSRYNVAGKGDGTGIENDMGAFEYQP